MKIYKAINFKYEKYIYKKSLSVLQYNLQDLQMFKNIS